VNTARGVATVGGVGTGVGGATVWHAASAKPKAIAVNARDGQRKGVAMGWILLEAFVALVIAVAIVWWTMSARRRPPPPRETHGDGQ
jgi:hypothetical protein